MKIINIIAEEKGSAEILAFIVVTPFIVWMFTYLIFGGLFLIEINELSTITNKKMDMAMVEGQFTTTLKNQLITELNSKGYLSEKLEITISPTAAGDTNNTTYIKRGNEISIAIIYKKAHPFYYLNFGLMPEDTFYPKTKVAGMSEKW